MNETTQNKFESKTTTQCIQPAENKNMNTTHSLNAGVAIGLAQKPNPAVPARAARPAALGAAQRKTLVLGLLAMATCAAAVLCLKAAVIINEVLASLDSVYNTFYT
jgi:hypothetical protein